MEHEKPDHERYVVPECGGCIDISGKLGTGVGTAYGKALDEHELCQAAGESAFDLAIVAMASELVVRCSPDIDPDDSIAILLAVRDKFVGIEARLQARVKRCTEIQSSKLRGNKANH